MQRHSWVATALAAAVLFVAGCGEDAGTGPGGEDVTATLAVENAPLGLVSKWPGEGNANDVQDGNHGTLQNGATFAAGIVGQAFRVQASLNSGVRIATNSNLNLTHITLHGWVKPFSYPNAAPKIIVRNTNALGSTQYLLALTDQGQAHCNIGQFADPVAGAVPLDVWTHLACTYDRQAVRLYVNGAEVAAFPATQAIPTSSRELWIGNEEGRADFNRQFDGLIDEVELYNRALSAAEIAGIYNASVDSDGDGAPNASDNCPGVANSDQLDADSDGLGDACDPDDDDDGVSDEGDNCLTVANADQTDTDGDGQGNACDADDDGDGVDDDADPCPLVAGPVNGCPKATATIALSNLNQVYDGTPKSATSTTDPAGLGVITITYDGSATAPTDAGSYAVLASLDNPSYEATAAEGTLVIAQAPQTITFTSTPSNPALIGAVYAVSATGGGSGNPVVFSSLTPGVCTVAGSTVSFVGVGICDVAANQLGNGNYMAAPPQVQAFGITYNFDGFFAPVDRPNTMNISKAGQTIPLKWRLTDVNGSPILNLSSVKVTVATASCSLGVTQDQLEEYATGSVGLQNNGDGYYQFNWKTPATYASSCKNLGLDLGEGSVRPNLALFTFKK